MSKFEGEYKLSVRSTERAMAALKRVEASATSVRFRTSQARPSKANRTSVVNGLIVWLDAQTPAEQLRILRESHEVLDRVMSGDGAPLAAEPQPSAGRTGMAAGAKAVTAPSRAGEARRRAK